MTMTFTNPVIPGFHPDPSVCRVDDSFYLVTSSFEYFPGLPLFQSTDLVSWQQIGHVLTRTSQLDLLNAGPSGGLFAPTIRHHDGRFYVTCTNVDSGGHFIVSSREPAGEWSDPVWIDQNGIDPSLFFHEGRCYFTSTVEPNPGKLHPMNPAFQRGAQQCLIDALSGEKLSESTFLWEGSGGRFPEAPHLYTRNGYYYLLLAEGGTEQGHMATVARSRTPWGPWEECPRNPVLSHRSLPSRFQAAGHADLVELADGTWWAVALATRPTGNVHHLGRETFLAPVTWSDDDWPTIGDEGRLPEHAEKPALPSSTHETSWRTEEFTAPVLAHHWNTLRRPLSPAQACLDEQSGTLRITGDASTTDDPLLVAVLRRQQHPDMRVVARLAFEPGAGDEAGLIIRADEHHHIDIAVRRGDRGRVVDLRHRIGPVQSVIASGVLQDGEVELRIDATAECYSFEVGHAGGTLQLGELPTRYLSSEVAGSFTGVFLGMYASGNGRRSTQPSWWSCFTYRPSGKS